MTATATTRLGIYVWPLDSDEFTRVQMDDSHNNLEARAGGFYYGASNPSPSAQYERSLFYNTSNQKIYFFNGIDETGAWIPLNDFVDSSRNINIGSGTATTINKVTITAPATGATLTLSNNSTFSLAGGHSLTLTTTGTTSLTLPVGGTVATIAGVESFSNKSLVDANVVFANTSDSTKRVRLDVSGVTTGTTRVLTVPNVNGTIVTTGDTGTVSSTMISAVDYTKVTDLQTWGDGRYYTETEVNNAYIYQWGNRPSGGAITNARQIYVQADAPTSAQDGDLWFDL